MGLVGMFKEPGRDLGSYRKIRGAKEKLVEQGRKSGRRRNSGRREIWGDLEMIEESERDSWSREEI